MNTEEDAQLCILFYLGNYTQLDWLCLNDNWGSIKMSIILISPYGSNDLPHSHRSFVCTSIREIPFCLCPNECSVLHWWAIQKEELTTNINWYINKKSFPKGERFFIRICYWLVNNKGIAFAVYFKEVHATWVVFHIELELLFALIQELTLYQLALHVVNIHGC